jgi:hypothetical protein
MPGIISAYRLITASLIVGAWALLGALCVGIGVVIMQAVLVVRLALAPVGLALRGAATTWTRSGPIPSPPATPAGRGAG